MHIDQNLQSIFIGQRRFGITLPHGKCFNNVIVSDPRRRSRRNTTARMRRVSTGAGRRSFATEGSHKFQKIAALDDTIWRNQLAVEVNLDSGADVQDVTYGQPCLSACHTGQGKKQPMRAVSDRNVVDHCWHCSSSQYKLPPFLISRQGGRSFRRRSFPHHFHADLILESPASDLADLPVDLLAD